MMGCRLKFDLHIDLDPDSRDVLNAAQWGTKLEGNGAFEVVDAQIPTVRANKFMRVESLDGIGRHVMLSWINLRTQ